jgi:plasmid stability protein
LTNLIVHNVDESVVIALTARAALNGISVEEEHRRILAKALLKPIRKSLAEALLSHSFTHKASLI